MPSSDSGPLPLSLTDSILASYRRWGIDPALYASGSIAPQDLATMLDQAAASPLFEHYRIFPSSFDPEDAQLKAFPRPPAPAWPSLERTLRALNSSAVMTLLPPFWQLEAPAHAACRNVGAALFVGEPENIPVAGAALVSARIDTVLCEAAAHAALSAHLHERGLPLPSRSVIVHRADAPSAWGEGPSTGGTCREVHAMPGIVVLEQCPILASRNGALFHRSCAYLWEKGEDGTRITSLGDDPFPLLRFPLPFRLTEEGSCPCGRTVVRA